MRRIMSLLLAVVLLLTGCGAQSGENQTARTGEETEKQTETVENGMSGEIAVQVVTQVTMELERAVYDPSVERMTYFIRNDSDKTVEFGEEYAIQRLEYGAWRDLEPEGDVAWIAIAYMLQPGGTMALTCSFDMYGDMPEAGTYRLVKRVGDAKLTAEFAIGESIYTAETPYGFAPLEQLPADYSAVSAGEMDTVFTAESVRNPEAVEEFLEKTGLGVNCQLRTVQDYGEGAPMVIDVIYENDHYLWRMWSDGDVSEKRFSYIVTDGEALYLANGVDWENQMRFGGNVVIPLLIPEGVTPEMVQAVEEQSAARLESNVTRYKVWSDADETGIWSAALWEAHQPQKTTEFSVERYSSEGGGWGSTYDLRDWGRTETEITAIEWRFGGQLRLTCLTADGGESILEFAPDAEQLISLSGQIPTVGN